MTARDRTVLIVVVALALVAGGWLLLLAPARKDATAQDAALDAARQRLAGAQQVLRTGEAAKAAYRDDYAAVSRLGKAVPADDDVPSLVVQLQGAADRTHTDFRSIALSTGSASAAALPTGGQTGAVASATGATGPSGSTGATGAAGAAPAPATQAAASTLPPGASVGAAGFPTMPFDLEFAGRFFRIASLLERLDRFTQVAGSDITVRGRLLSVDGFTLTPSAPASTRMRASIHATAYLLPPGGEAATPTATTTTAALPAVGGAVSSK